MPRCLSSGNVDMGKQAGSDDVTDATLCHDPTGNRVVAKGLLERLGDIFLPPTENIRAGKADIKHLPIAEVAQLHVHSLAHFLDLVIIRHQQAQLGSEDLANLAQILPVQCLFALGWLCTSASHFSSSLCSISAVLSQ